VNKLILSAFLIMASTVTMANNIEEPSWELLTQLDNVEIRKYHPSIQATTVLDSSRQTSEGFRRLAGFIFGGNERSQSIAMTAPVQETLEHTQPIMAFTMPAQYALEDLPTPADDSIRLVEVPERTVAAVAFSGWATAAKVDRHSAELLATLRRNNIEIVGVTALNQYNPPWTLPFKRRNEIVVEVKMADTRLAAR
jgi:hypothetical protein